MSGSSDAAQAVAQIILGQLLWHHKFQIESFSAPRNRSLHINENTVRELRQNAGPRLCTNNGLHCLMDALVGERKEEEERRENLRRQDIVPPGCDKRVADKIRSRDSAVLLTF